VEGDEDIQENESDHGENLFKDFASQPDLSFPSGAKIGHKIY
jgi:hypothetical protein